MTPNAIHEYVSKYYPQLAAETRSNPDGWSFFLGPKVASPSSNRIFRVLVNGGTNTSNLKLAVTSRLTSDLEFNFRGDEAELKALIDREMNLYQQNSGGNSIQSTKVRPPI